MAKDTEFAAMIREALSPMGDVATRSMFGGFNVSLDGLTFGIIADDQLYLKVDDRTRGRYEAAGLKPFKPFPDKPASKGYYAVPDALLDEPETLCDWARDAFDAALRVRAAKPKSARRKAKTQ